MCRFCGNGKWKRFLGCGKAADQTRENVDMGSAVLLVWGVGLYLWRVLHGFPVSVEDPGRTLYEVLTV